MHLKCILSSNNIIPFSKHGFIVAMLVEEHLLTVIEKDLSITYYCFALDSKLKFKYPDEISGTYVKLWFPQIVTFFISSTFTFILSAI